MSFYLLKSIVRNPEMDRGDILLKLDCIQNMLLSKKVLDGSLYFILKVDMKYNSDGCSGCYVGFYDKEMDVRYVLREILKLTGSNQNDALDFKIYDYTKCDNCSDEDSSSTLSRDLLSDLLKAASGVDTFRAKG